MVCHNTTLVFYPREKVTGYFYTIPFVSKLKANNSRGRADPTYSECCAGGHGRLCWLKGNSGHRNAGGRSCWSSQCVLECQGLVIIGREPTASAQSSLQIHEIGQKVKSFHCFFFNETLKKSYKGNLFYNYYILLMKFWKISKCQFLVF